MYRWVTEMDLAEPGACRPCTVGKLPVRIGLCPRGWGVLRLRSLTLAPLRMTGGGTLDRNGRVLGLRAEH